VSVVRSLERRLERLIEGVAGRVFSGRLHPSELAGKLAREADFARFEHEAGPATANRYIIEVNPKDLNVDPSELEEELAVEVTKYTSEEGLRLEGSVSVDIKTNEQTATGSVTVHVEVQPGPTVSWARLRADSQTLEITHNRVTVGRAPDTDVRVDDSKVSRRHALIWRKNGQTWIQDLGSSNGTTLNGMSVSQEPMKIETGSVIAFADSTFRFTVV